MDLSAKLRDFQTETAIETCLLLYFFLSELLNDVSPIFHGQWDLLSTF